MISTGMTSISLDETGKLFGGRDHSTALNGITKVETRMKKDHTYAENVQVVEGLDFVDGALELADVGGDLVGDIVGDGIVQDQAQVSCFITKVETRMKKDHTYAETVKAIITNINSTK